MNENLNIRMGDKVKHRTNQKYNVLNMEVLEVTDKGKCLCQYFDPFDKSYKNELFKKNDLILIEPSDGGFRG